MMKQNGLFRHLILLMWRGLHTNNIFNVFKMLPLESLSSFVCMLPHIGLHMYLKMYQVWKALFLIMAPLKINQNYNFDQWETSILKLWLFFFALTLQEKDTFELASSLGTYVIAENEAFQIQSFSSKAIQWRFHYQIWMKALLISIPYFSK